MRVSEQRGLEVLVEGRLELVNVDGGKAVRASVGFAPGSVVTSYGIGAIVPAPERYSIQIGASRHILPDPDFLRFLNHSCVPNVFVDTADMSVRAITRIEPGDSLDYFYPSTEWSMNEPFACECGARDCLGIIRGAAWLAAGDLARYRLSDHVAKLVRARDARRRRVAKPACRVAAP